MSSIANNSTKQLINWQAITDKTHRKVAMPNPSHSYIYNYLKI